MVAGLFQYSSAAVDPIHHPPIPISNCPCCGGAAVAFSWVEPINAEYWEVFAAEVGCHDCGLKMESTNCDVTDREATVLHTIEAWNKRV